jgi:MoaA/NifB/PqqE/SkfB family radical SAM enzyme
MFDQVPLLIKRLKTSRHHSGSGEGTSLWRLIRQGLPYYLDRRGRAAPPLTLFFVINGKCNLRCRLCDFGQQNQDSTFYKNLRGRTGQDFPFERFKSLMDEVEPFRPYIGITTTEPFLYPNIFDVVDYAARRGMNSNVSTNGLLLEKYVDDILDSGLHRLSISLDGPAPVHDKMRGLERTYERVTRGLSLLNEKKASLGSLTPHIYISTFISDANHAHLVEFMENLPVDGIDRINMKLMVFSTREMVEKHNRLFGDRYPTTEACIPRDFTPENVDIKVLRDQALEINSRFGSVCTLHFEPDSEKLERYFFRPLEFMDSTRCVLPWFVTQITNDGDILVLTRCYNLSLGNVMDTPFAEVWNGAKMRRFRVDLRKHGRFPGCARCDGVLYR